MTTSKKPRKPTAAEKFAKLEWSGSDDSGGLMVVSKTQTACIARYFKNSAGSVTALWRTYKDVRGAKRAIERAFVCVKRKATR